MGPLRGAAGAQRLRLQAPASTGLATAAPITRMQWPRTATGAGRERETLNGVRPPAVALVGGGDSVADERRTVTRSPDSHAAKRLPGGSVFARLLEAQVPERFPQ